MCGSGLGTAENCTHRDKQTLVFDSTPLIPRRYTMHRVPTGILKTEERPSQMTGRSSYFAQEDERVRVIGSSSSTFHVALRTTASQQ